MPAQTRMTTAKLPLRNWSSRVANRSQGLDVNGDSKLSFEEWTVKTIDKFSAADADKSKALTAAEYATTAPKPKARKPACSCN